MRDYRPEGFGAEEAPFYLSQQSAGVFFPLSTAPFVGRAKSGLLRMAGTAARIDRNEGSRRDWTQSQRTPYRRWANAIRRWPIVDTACGSRDGGAICVPGHHGHQHGFASTGSWPPVPSRDLWRHLSQDERISQTKPPPMLGHCGIGWPSTGPDLNRIYIIMRLYSQWTRHNLSPLQRGDRLQTSESDVYRRQILTSKTHPRRATVKILLMAVDL